MLKINSNGNGTIVLLTLILVVGVGFMPAHAVSKDIKVLRIGIGIDADTLNPLELTTAIPANLAELMYETLLKMDAAGNVIPNLATDWSVSEDGKTWTVKLRRGIKFTDGTTLNAQTLKSHLALIQNPEVRMPLRFVFGPIERITVVDEYTVEYSLKAPFAPFDQLLATVMFPISQKRATNYDADSFGKHSAGAGPYKLAEWIRGERIVLVRNENYWGKRPTVEKLIYQIIPETATRVAMLRAGQLDVIYSPTPADVPALEADPDVTVVRPLSNRMIVMGMNTQKFSTTNKLLRQAFNYAVDKKAITERILFNTAEPLDAPMPSNIFGYVRMDKQYEYNPEKAKELLKQANFSKDTVVKLIAPVGRYTYDKQVAEAVQAYLKDVGVKTQLQVYDWPSYMRMIVQPEDKTKIEVYLIGWGWPILDADGSLLMFFSSFVHPPKGLNATFYQNPQFDQAVGGARQSMDPVKRRALYQQAANMVWDDATAIWLYVEPYMIVHKSRYKGLDIRFYERLYPTYATME